MIKHKDELLQQISDGLWLLSNSTMLGCIEVSFIKEGHVETTVSLSDALDYLAKGIYWNRDGNWSDADTAEVKLI